MRDSTHVLPLAGTVTGVWEHPDVGKYPEAVKVPMADGTIQTYRLDVEQPHPCLVEVMDILQRMPYYGGYKGKHEKKRARRADSPTDS